MTTGAKTVTILFTDLVGSTELLQEAGDERAQRIFKAHHRLLSEAVQRHGGNEVKWLGDGLMVAFDSAQEAVKCAMAMQQASRRPTAGERLQIRVGLNVGEALTDESDYFGTSVVVARRLCDSAGAGQIYASDIVVRLLDGLTGDVSVSALGSMELKGITNPIPAVEIGYQQDPMAMLRKLPFVGRQEEYDKLLSALADAGRGQGSVALIAGEPGIGKTRLVDEFCEHAASSATVIRGDSYEGDIAAPFGPWVEALDSLINQLSDEELRAAVGEGAPELASLLPQVRKRLPDVEEPPKLDPESERARLFESVSRFLQGASELRSLVIFLDDLHWCDKPSLALLEQVARGIGDKRIMIVGTYRDVEVDRGHPLEQTLATLLRLEHHRRILLTGFSEESVYDLLNVIEPSEEAEAAKRSLAGVLYGEAQGHPFFMREVMIDLVESGKLVQQDGVWTGTVATIEELGIPDGVKEAIERRLSGLGEGCNRMLRQASALTGGFTWDELRAISEDSEDDLLDALDEALGAQLLEEQGKLSYRFTHALIRATLYDELSAPRRVRLHGRIAEALETLYADDLESHLGELAAHYVAAGSDLEKAIDYSVRAGGRAQELFAWEEATAHYNRALETMRLAKAADDEKRCRVLLALAECHTIQSRVEAVTLAREAIELARSLGSAELFAKAAIAFDLGAYALEEDRTAERLELMDEALVLLGDEESALKVLTLRQWVSAAAAASNSRHGVASASYFAWGGEPEEEVLARAREAVEIADRLGDDFGLSIALGTLHDYSWTPDNDRERLQLADRAIAAAKRAGSLDMEVQAVNLRAQDLLALGDVEEFRRNWERYCALVERLRPDYDFSLLMQIGLEIAGGQLETGERLLTEQAARPMRDVAVGATFAAQQNFLRHMQGRLHELEDVSAQSVEQFPGVLSYVANHGWTLACSGKAEQARARVDQLVSDSAVLVPRDYSWKACTELAGDTCAEVGYREKGQVVFRALAPYASTPTAISQVLPLGSTARVVGRLAALLELWDEAEQHFDEAVQANDRMGFHAWTAWTRLNYGEMLLKRAETDGAKPDDRLRGNALLEEALSFAREAGMGKVQRDAERLLGLSETPAVVSGDAGGTVVAESIEKSFAVGRYVAKRLLGQGAQKSVYMVDDTTLGRECAVSVLNPALLDQGDIVRIKQEAQTMAQFGTHPNIVTVYDYGEEDGAPFVVCEYVPGGELRDELRRANGPLALDRAVALASDLCRALSFAHGKGIVHRDLKPENVWLTRDGAAKLGDFGIALAAGRTRLTMPGGASGTPLYMAPEQASGGDIGPAADLYALGALLYELVAGRPPFIGGDPNAIIYQHRNDEPEPPSTLNANLPPELESLILRLLAKQPGKRYASADEVLGALRAFA